MDRYDEDFLKKTIEIWQPYSPVPLSSKDAIEIIKNMTSLFNLLIEIDLKNHKNNVSKECKGDKNAQGEI